MVFEFTREGEDFLREMEMMTWADVEGNITFQHVSIVVDAVFLVLNAKGIIVSVREGAMTRATLKDILKAIQNSTPMRRAIQAFFIAWKQAGGCMMRRAYALLRLLWQCSVHGILWAIIKSRYEGMSKTDWCKVSLSLGTLFVAPAIALGVNTMLFVHDLHGFADNIKKVFT
ncbi:uncharacterized protein LOC122962377 [Acropora millepora]|uniref:uncharacterized protein LOC122962377 n=1 Tax=Acropora millepora TaxID=45264 RepID=UPI001CF23658|nr:uncharacterized protein LOC122962377 [Acropora millepora]